MHKNIENYLQSGQEFERTANWSKAVDSYNQAIQLNPIFAPAYYYRGLLYSKLGDDKQALSDFIQALKIDPGLNNYWGIKKNNYINDVSSYDLLDSYDEQAFEEYIQVLQTRPLGASDYYKRGIVRSELGDVQGTLKDLNKSIRLDPSLSEAYFERGRIFYEINNFSKNLNANNTKSAISDYNRTLHFNPNLADAYYNRGVIRVFDARYRTIGFPLPDLKGGLEDLNEAIRLNPNHAEAYFARSIACCIRLEVEQKRSNSPNLYKQLDILLPDVLKDVIQALRLDPDVTKLVRHPGKPIKLIKLGDKRRAVEKFTQLIQRDSENIEAYYNRGWARLKIGEQQGAVEDLTWSIERNAQDAEAYCIRGFAYYQLQNYQQAIEDYSKAIELDPILLDAYLLRSLLRYDSGDEEGALEDADQAIEIDSDLSYNAYVLRSQILYNSENSSKALQDLFNADRALTVYLTQPEGEGYSSISEGSALGQNPEFLYKKGMALAKRGDTRAAIQHLEQARSLFFYQGKRQDSEKTRQQIERLKKKR